VIRRLLYARKKRTQVYRWREHNVRSHHGASDWGALVKATDAYLRLILNNFPPATLDLTGEQRLFSYRVVCRYCAIVYYRVLTLRKRISSMTFEMVTNTAPLSVGFWKFTRWWFLKKLALIAVSVFQNVYWHKRNCPKYYYLLKINDDSLTAGINISHIVNCLLAALVTLKICMV
jgi:hypothetical protein